MINFIVRDFMSTTRIVETPDKTVEKIMDFLSKAESVNKMIAASEMGFPALTGVVRELEEQFANSDFPLHHEGKNANSTNRRNIGWMIKYILREYGYTPCGSGRVCIEAGSKYFTTASKYKKTIDNPTYSIQVYTESIYNN